MCVGILLCLTIKEITGRNKSFESHSLVSFVLMFVPIIILFLAIRRYKRKHQGIMTWKEGVREGFKVSLVFGIISPFIVLIYYTLINPAIIESVKEAYGMTDKSNALVIISDMVAQLLMALVFGVIISMIVSLFLKTRLKK
jgi:FtsH-binding integral membrane protein